MNRWWMNPDWRNDPLIQRSRNPLLKSLAMDQVRIKIAYHKTPETMGMIYVLSHRQDDTATGYKWEVVSGAYLIPGSKTDNGVRCSSRQIGALIEYDDGRVLWDVFSLSEIYQECITVQQPQQLRMVGF